MPNTIYTSEKVLPYVYLGIHRETGHFYFGSRTAKTQKYPSHLDIMKYKTSSRYIKELGFDNFDWQIVAEFFDQHAALEFEYECIGSTMNNPLSLNFNNAGSKYSTAGLTNGKAHREKISKADYSSRRGTKAWHNNRKGSKWYHDEFRDYMLFENDPLIEMLNLERGRKYQYKKPQKLESLSHIVKIIKFTNVKIDMYEKVVLKGSKLYHSKNGDHFQLNDNDPRIKDFDLQIGKTPGTHHKATLGTKWYHDSTGKTYALKPNDPKIELLSLIIGRKK